MNFEIVKKVVQYIDENYHSDITNEIIKDITGYSAGYVRNEFKKLININVEEYRGKRQLALIIKEIKELNSDLKNSNLLPWSNENSFTKAFKEKYGITPKMFVKNYQEDVLQARIDVSEKELSYNKDVQIIESLVRRLGSKKNALLFILSLKPYTFNNIERFFVICGTNIKNNLIKSKYEQLREIKIFSGDIPKDFYNKHIKLLDTFYDTNVGRVLLEPNVFKIDVLFNQRYVVKDNLKNILLDSKQLDSIINESMRPSDLVTLWYEEIKPVKIKNRINSVPPELIDANLNMMKRLILEKLFNQEQGLNNYSTMVELKDELLWYNLVKPIFNEDYKNNNNKFTDDSKWLYAGSLSDSKEEYYNNSDYEILTMKRLCQEIKELLIDGLLYFNYYE